MIGHITYLSDDAMMERFGRALPLGLDPFHFDVDFEIGSYLRPPGRQVLGVLDATPTCFITGRSDYFDPAAAHEDNRPGRSPRARPGSRRVVTSDWRFAPSSAEENRQGVLDNHCDVSYAEIDAPHGHDAFLLDDARYHALVAGLLRRHLRAPMNGREQDTLSGRSDFQAIAAWVRPDSTVLDLGCATGPCSVPERRPATRAGKESDIDDANVLACVQNGVKRHPERSRAGTRRFRRGFPSMRDLSQTLQRFAAPRRSPGDAAAWREAIVSFPNFGRLGRAGCRSALGRMPVSPELPYQWYNTPNVHLFTHTADFESFCSGHASVCSSASH